MLLDNTNILNTPVRRLEARVELYNGSTLVNTFTPDGALKSFSIERIGESGKFFGYGVCQKMSLKLVDKYRQIHINTSNSYKPYLSAGGDLVCAFPEFRVSEVHRDENTNELSITAYDRLYDTTQTIDDINLAAYSIRELAEAIAALIGADGIEIVGVGESETCFDTYYPDGANFEGIENIREILNDIAEATQTIYYINYNNKLVFKRLNLLNETDLTITKSDYIELKSGDNRRLSAICSATELGDNVIASLAISGTTQYVRDNAFWELREDIDTLIEAALEAVGGLTINQFECKWRGNFLLEIGDKLALTAKDDSIIYSYLLDDKLEYNGGLSQSTQWHYAESEETAANPSTLGEVLKQTYARVDKANKEITLVVDETASLKMTTNGIEATVNNLADEVGNLSTQVKAKVDAESVNISIEKALEDGVEKVITSTGYTLDNEGLRISKTDSEIETLISDDGMKISKSGNEVLKADNQGVKAEDLHATTYLIIGDNSRLEDFGNRTGCFWIGG